VIFRSRAEVLRVLRNAPKSKKLSSSQQKRLLAIQPDKRIYMGTDVWTELTVDTITEIIRFLEDEEGWEND